MTHMRRGEFAAAWAINDADLAARAAAGHPAVWHRPRHRQPVWDGSPVAGRRVLVRCYHGLGDTVQFVRFCRPLRLLAAEVIVWAQPSLCGLVATAAGVDRVIPLHDGAADVAYDVDVEVMELPHLLRADAATLAADVPYLHATPVARRPGRFTVGVVWQAGGWDGRRSVPVELLVGAMRDVPGVDWLVLQRGAEPPAGFGTAAGADDGLAAAAVVRSVDVVLTVDSFPAHLGGAVGAATWVMLHADADWRWMADRTDSPWYPTARLFRQRPDRPGDWRPVAGRRGGGTAARHPVGRARPAIHLPPGNARPDPTRHVGKEARAYPRRRGDGGQCPPYTAVENLTTTHTLPVIGATRPTRRRTWAAAALVVVPWAWFVVVGNRGIDFGRHWDQPLLVADVRQTLRTRTLLPTGAANYAGAGLAGGHYEYPSGLYWVGLAMAAPRVWASGAMFDPGKPIDTAYVGLGPVRHSRAAGVSGDHVVGRRRHVRAGVGGGPKPGRGAGGGDAAGDQLGGELPQPVRRPRRAADSGGGGVLVGVRGRPAAAAGGVGGGRDGRAGDGGEVPRRAAGRAGRDGGGAGRRAWFTTPRSAW